MEHKRSWTLIESTMGFSHLIYDAENRLVCTTEGTGGADWWNELANGWLIATAPEMLQALRDLLPRLCCWCAQGKPYDGTQHSWGEIVGNIGDIEHRARCQASEIRALIAKADPQSGERKDEVR